jgi:hypothetical protein
MPADQRVGFDNGEGVLPIKPAGQSGESESDGIVRAAWFDSPLTGMRDLIILAGHVIATVMKLVRPSGVRAVVAESVLAKHQLLI